MKKAVYLIQADKDIRELIISILSFDDLSVTAFSCLVDFQQKMPLDPPGLFIVDNYPYQDDGCSKLKEIRSIYASMAIPILLLMENTIDHVQARPDVELLEKPFDINDFSEKVKKLLG